MSDIAISVESLGKAYHIGLKDEVPDSLVSALGSWVKSPLRNFKRLGRLDTAKATSKEAKDIFWALRDVSFEVKRGEVVGIIGRNGAGKSTLLKILSRITEPTAGRAVIRGRVSSLLEVGTGFHPELSGRENVYMNGTILGMTKREIDRKFDEIVDFSGIEKFLDTPVKRYSSGMKVRLAFAVAAHLEPEILIIDEVLAVGDAEFQKKCMGKMQNVAGESRTVLFVSHNIAAVESLCTRGVFMEQGKVSDIGEIRDVISSYMGSLRHQGSIGIAQRTDRDGDGSARCTGIWFEQEDGTPTSMICVGDALRICIRYELYDDASRFQFRLGLYDGKGYSLAHNSTNYVPISTGPVPREGVLTCQVRSLPLPPGAYYINTSIVRDSNHRADRVEHAASINVEARDFYGSGNLPPAEVGKYLLDYSWALGSLDTPNKREQ